MKTIADYNLRSDTVISVKRNIPMSGLGNGLSVKIKLAESVVSSSENVEDKDDENNINFDDSPMAKSIQKI